MRTLIFWIFFGLFSGLTYAQKTESVTINACAKGAENRMARLYLEDAVTKFQWKVDEQPIDTNGCFRLNCELLNTQKGFIKIDFYPTYIYLEPGENYRIIYDSFDFRIDERVNPQKLNSYLPYRFETPDSNELNQLIWRFETLHDRFLADHYHFRKGILKNDYQDFKLQIERTFAFTGHFYFNVYKRYALADMERIFNFETSANLFLTYLQNKPIYYENTAFTDFITEYYATYFPQQIQYNRRIFTNQINRVENLPAIMDSLGRDTTLQNEKYREFVFLLGLQKMYHNSEFQPSSILQLLQMIRTTTKFQEHSVLANCILQTLEKFKPGLNQANFKFLNPENQTLCDMSASSKYKYVMFVNGLCQSCDAEIRTLQTIAGKLRDSVDFWVVNCDYELNRCLHNKPKTLQNITYLHFNKDFETLESLGIGDFPMVVWLDPQNKIQSYFFPLPSQRAERSIRQSLKTPK